MLAIILILRLIIVVIITQQMCVLISSFLCDVVLRDFPLISDYMIFIVLKMIKTSTVLPVKQNGCRGIM